MRSLALATALTLGLALTACNEAAPADEADTAETADTAEVADTESAAPAAAETAAPAATASAAPALASADTPQMSGPTKARCKLTSIKADETYNGPCMFESTGGASFIIDETKTGGFPDGVSQISLEADTPTIANLSVRAADGEMVDLGTANKKGACWQAEEWEVCAYAE